MKNFFDEINIKQSAVLLVLMMVLLIQGPMALAQDKKKKKKKKPEFGVALRLGVLYDDNILKYSEQYLERFMNGEDYGRFHIETYDDVIFVTGVEAAAVFRIFGKRKTVFNANYTRRTYAVNSIKDWNYFAVGARQYLPWRMSFKILYSYIPSFYVRHFRDDLWVDVYGYAPLTFQPYIFEKDNFGIWAQKYFLKGSRIKLSYFYSRYYHNEYYTEYDSKNHMYGIQFYQKITKNLRFDIGYYYITSDAKGYDEAVETPENTNGPDATYEEDRITGGFQYSLPRINKKRHAVDFHITFMNRYYLSEHPWQIDRLHAGRVDNNMRFLAGYNIRMSKAVTLKAFYNWMGRDSGSTAEANDLFVSREKDYKQNVFGVEMIYSIDF